MMADIRRRPLCCCDFTASAFDAVLHDWILVAWPGLDDAYMIAGVITGDRKGRFADGRGIHTSMILTAVESTRP